jgi:hypothetical protein
MPYRLDIPGFMSLEALFAIETLAECVPPNGIIVEIGSYLGRSSWTWSHSADPSVTIYCIDPWPSKITERDNAFLREAKHHSLKNEFLDNVKDCPNIIPIQGYSPSMPWDKNLIPNLTFIDGNHLTPYVAEDIAFWAKQMNYQGILCGHDFDPLRFPDVCEAVWRFTTSIEKPLRVFRDNTIWYIVMDNLNISNSWTRPGLFLANDDSCEITPEVMEICRKLYDTQERSKG